MRKINKIIKDVPFLVNTNKVMKINSYYDQGVNYDCYLTDFTFEDDNNIYNVYITDKGYYGDWYLITVNGQKYASNNLWSTEIHSDHNTKADISWIEYDDISSDTIILNNLSLVNKDCQEEIKKAVLLEIEYIENQLKLKHEKYNNFYLHRKVVLSIVPNTNMWKVYVVLNEMDNLYQVVFCDNGEELCLSQSFVLETESINIVIDYIDTNYINPKDDMLSTYLKQYHNMRLQDSNTDTESDESDDDDNVNIKKTHEHARNGFFHCQTYGKDIYNLIKNKYTICDTIYKTKCVNNSDDSIDKINYLFSETYPHFFPAFDFQFWATKN
jgi:hypothetical protein